MKSSFHISWAIREYLDANGLRSYHLASLSGCNKTALNAWLYQRQLPSTSALIRLADYMNLSLDYMLGRTKNKSFIRSGNPEKFGRRFYSLPLPDGMTYYKLAQKCNIGTSAMSKWKDLKRLPEISVLETLADTFDCSVDFLVGRTNIPYND